MYNAFSRKVITSCFLAACLEMYDFAIFGFLTSVIYKNYLSFADETTAKIISFSFFAIGFVVRPIGSLIFGYIGDVYGRKKALVLSVSCMGLASLCMSLLPPYSVIGIASCYAIILIRIVQGVSVGGEYSGAIIYTVEHFDSKRSGLVGGIIICGCISGVLFATIISNILQASFLPTFSWRLAFFIGFGLSVIGFFVRKNLMETPEFLKLAKSKSKSQIPLIDGFKQHPKECFGTIAVAASNGINFYFILIFLPGYVNEMLGISISYFPIITTIVLVIASPIFSYLSDFTGRSEMLGYGLLGTAAWSYMGLNLLLTYQTIEIAILFFVIHALIYSTQAGVANVFIVEAFPTKFRYSCAAFCYSLGIGVIGGTSPMVASILINKYTSYASILLSIYMTIIPLVGYMGMILVRNQQSKIIETNNKLIEITKITT